MQVRTIIFATVVLGASSLAPVALAERPDDRAGVRGPGGIAALQTGAARHPDSRAVRGVGTTSTAPRSVAIRPDDQAGMRGPGAFDSSPGAAATHPDNRDAARGPGALTPTIGVASTDGFDWGDALIGLLAGMGSALLLAGGFIVLASQRTRTRVA